jgi:glutamate synthase (NADPH) large chain
MTLELENGLPKKHGLYDPAFEKDSCGVGFIAHIKGVRSHSIVRDACIALTNMDHRGACGCEANTGDGAGIMTAIPDELMRAEAQRLFEVELPEIGRYAVAQVFLPRDESQRAICKETLEGFVKAQGQKLIGWRPVPTDAQAADIGKSAAATEPIVEQLFVAAAGGLDRTAFCRQLYLIRKQAFHTLNKRGLSQRSMYYVCSFSSRIIVYKGQLTSTQVVPYFPDLADPRYTSHLAMVHSRFSTNTFPSWERAQPMRFMCHNGEINTLRGNANWMAAREGMLESELFGDELKKLLPITDMTTSDSGVFDNVLELLLLGGRSLPEAVMMMIPEAWQNHESMPQEKQDFYEYHSCLMEPWDGPASVAFCDGRYIGAVLDRNGLRPSRYYLTTDDRVIMASEVGVLPVDPKIVREKGRLQPGRMFLVDFDQGRLIPDEQLKKEVATKRPYGEWVRRQRIELKDLPLADQSHGFYPESLLNRMQAFGYSTETMQFMLLPLVHEKRDPVGSMGNDSALACLSDQPRMLYDYFKQLFAQVTNPPIDSIREKIVMSLSIFMGRRKSWLEESGEHARMIRIDSPFLLDYELKALQNIEHPSYRSETIFTHFSAEKGPSDLQAALQSICAQASQAIEAGKCIIVLSDRFTDASKIPIPMLLAVGAVHHYLIREGIRLRASLVCESGEARDVHHFACLVGYGASAVNPYIAIDTIRQGIESGDYVDPLEKALAMFRGAIESGMLKIMSKMGISTISSYRGAQIFEAIGLSQEVIDLCFFGTTSQMGGISLSQIAEDAIRRHQQAFANPESASLEEGGNYTRAKRGSGEFHAFNPQVVTSLHRFLKSNNPEEFQKYAEVVETREPVAPRDLLRFKSGSTIPVDEVESIENIRIRFTTAGMSLGALSPEAHECLAIAMNSIGGKSNSGEGGEDPARNTVRPNGDHPSSAIKQVASGRFGVTPEYLASAQELEIKMAQGSKPGEGGQLPGHKVSPMIAKLRHSVPGVPLISPPPHHDIYSIEDLAQLIYDLKQVNPRAKVCVKLVSCSGVGTVAAGVAKAYADVILISGHDGGTGASPLSSIKHAGGPFEFGVAEAHQTLMLNDLRSRIVLRTDGGIKTGRDIVMAALLGAEEFNFGTAALIAAGCAMFRVCHLNTCPVGVATQKEELRLKFRGKPENVVAFFNGVAQEVREILAQLGFRSLDEIVGRTDLLERRPLEDFPEEIRAKVASLDLSRLLYQVDTTGTADRIHTRERNERFGDSSLDDKILLDAKVALNGRGAVKLNYTINNVHRNIGTRVSGLIGYNYGDKGLPEGAIDITFKGSAGQSFGAFLAHGIRLKLFGEANDYVGKGMNGGEIIVRPPDGCKFEWANNILIGNTVMYGATGGKLFAAGRAGERFCVRNSGGAALVEGIGDHGCEYMTGGTVVVLGSTGRNFGAGMSGGLAYVYDPEDIFAARYNNAMVGIERLRNPEEIKSLQSLIYAHLEHTESARANDILKNWTDAVGLFWRVVPHPAEAKPASKPIHEPTDEQSTPAPVGGF